MNATELVQLGMRHQAAGRLVEAEDVYRRVLAGEPGNAHALHYLGLIAHQRGRPVEAIGLVERSVAAAPGVWAFQRNLAEVYRAAGREADAIAALARAAELAPGDAGVLGELGMMLGQAGRLEEAAEVLARAVKVAPGRAEARINLGVVLAKLGRHGEAVGVYREAIGVVGEQAIVLVNLGLSLKALGKFEEAVGAYERACAAMPGLAEAQEYRGVALEAMGRYDEAVGAHREAVRLRPGGATAWNNLGVALQKVGDAAGAVGALREAVRLSPGYAEAHRNLGTALMDLGRVDEALGSYGRAVELSPENATFRLDRAMGLLAAGDYVSGWREYECRSLWAESSGRGAVLRYPRWDGAETAGTVLVHAEQGFGDAIQMARYFPRVARRCGRVVIECQPGLERLFAESMAGATVVAAGGALPEGIDCQVAMCSLPGVFGTTVETIPAGAYLRAPRECVARWRERLGVRDGRVRVGLVWRGSRVDVWRGMGLGDLRELGRVGAGVRFVGLQLGAAEEIAREAAGGGWVVEDWSGGLTDFAETAAAIENLDLVISVDTAVAHLAGALGRPVWTLLRFAPDWRWTAGALEGRTRWYAGMRLFRQGAAGEWAGVVRRVAEELGRVVGSGGVVVDGA